MKRINIMLLLAAIGMVTFGMNRPVSAQEGSGTATATPLGTAVIDITPRADGSIVHIVGPDDSFWTIAIRYAAVLEMTPEQALVHIQQLNGNPTFAVLGQELLIREAGNFVGSDSEATAVIDVTPTIEGTVVPGASTPTTEGAATEEVIIVAPLSTTTTPEAPPAAELSPLGSVCVTSFEDINGNSEFEKDAESLIADAAVTLFKEEQTISTFVTDGVMESHCFEDLAEGAYQVQIYPPVNYVATTADSWTVTVSDGAMVPVEFGMQFKETQVAEGAASTDGTTAENGAATAVPTTNASEPETSAEAESGGLFTNVGTIVVIVAIVLILLAGAGVVMLRRS